MRFEQYLTICATAVLAWFASATGAAAQNLVQNSGFEEGSSYPMGWEKPDDIACFWDASGLSGRCLVFNTHVTVAQRQKAAEEKNKGKLGALPKATHTTTTDYTDYSNSYNNNYNNSYNRTRAARELQKQREKEQALAAHPTPKGVGAWGSLIPVKTGQWYILEADVYGPQNSKPSLCIRGYRRMGLSEAGAGADAKSWFFQINGFGPWFEDASYGTEQRGPIGLDYLQTFRYNVVCQIPAAGGKTWQHFQHPFMIPAKPKDDAAQSGAKTVTKLGERTKTTGLDMSVDTKKAKLEQEHPEYRTESILLHPYAETPAGIYRFDNISVRPVTAETAENLVRDLDQEPVKW